VKYQNDPELESIVHNACRFNCIALAREALVGRPWTLGALVDAWVGAKERKIIGTDNAIVDDQALFDYLEVPLRYVPAETLGMPTVLDSTGISRVAQATSPLDPARYWVLERWFWQQSHFVKGCGVPTIQPEYDPIQGGSLTRLNGSLMDLRVFIIVRR
jgi:hypothetical protein